MTSAAIIDAAARVRLFRLHGIGLILAILIYLGLCALIGLWAGRVAQRRGRQFSLYFVIAFVVSLCGLIPGIVVVIVAYVQGPSGGMPGQLPVGPGGPQGGQFAPTPPPGPQMPPPPGPHASTPPPPPTPAGSDAGGQVKQNPDGGYDFTPPKPEK